VNFLLCGGRSLEYTELILFLTELCKRENVRISWDLNVEIKIDKNISSPINMSMFCFLKSSILDPSKKNKAIEARTAATITIDKLSIIIIYIIVIIHRLKFKNPTMDPSL
jgi:hypothetical protein